MGLPRANPSQVVGVTPPFWRQIVLSFSSGNFYRTVIHQPLAKSFRYLALLILAASLVLSARYAILFHHFLGEAEEWAWEYLPEIWIEKGEVRSDVDQPWSYETDDLVFILDTTGEIQEIPSDFPQGILLEQGRLTYKRQRLTIPETRHYDLSTVESFHLNAETIGSFRKWGPWVFWPFLFGILFGYFIVGKSVQVIAFSGISIAANWASRRALPYQALLNIGIYALTLPFLLGTALDLFVFGEYSPFLGLVFVAIYGALLVAAVLQCGPPRQATPEETPP